MHQDRIFSSIFVVILFFLFSSSAKVCGAGGFFGVQERIKCLQPIAEPSDAATPKPFASVVDINHPKYSLCYKYTILLFFAGVYLHDDRYVLAEKDDAFTYVPLDDAKIADYQEKGILPKPLPAYSIPWSQYAVGYSLWLLLAACTAGTVLWTRLKAWKNRGKKCLRCGLNLIPEDFNSGKCGACGEPVPVTSRSTDPITGS